MAWLVWFHIPIPGYEAETKLNPIVAWLLVDHAFGRWVMAWVVVLMFRAQALSAFLKSEPPGPGPWTGVRGLLSALALLVHLVTFLVAVWLAQRDLGEDTELWVRNAWVVAVWVTVCAWVVAWGPLVRPFGFWRRAWEAAGRQLVLGAVVFDAAMLLGKFTQGFWDSLRWPTLYLVRLVVQLFTDRVVYNPEEFRIGTTTYSVTIAGACSGYEGVGLVVGLLGAYLVLARKTIDVRRAWWVVPVAAMVSWLLNIVRVCTFIALGTLVSVATAQGGFHSYTGWLFVVSIVLGAIAVTQRYRLTPIVATGESPAMPYLMPLIVLMMSMMVTKAMSADFEVFYPVRVVTTAIALGYFADTWRKWEWRPSLVSVGVGTLVFALWVVLEPEHLYVGLTPDALTAMGPALSNLWIVLRVLGSVLVVPFVEELAFRGYLERRLHAEQFESVEVGRVSLSARLGASLLFGLMHSRVIAGTLAGLMFSYAAQRRGRLADAIVAHAVANALVAVQVLAFRDFDYW